MRLIRCAGASLLVLFGSYCSAQTVTVRVISAIDGSPLQKQRALVTLLYGKGDERPAKYDASLSLETDANGEAKLMLPDPSPGHLAVRLEVNWGRWDCGCNVLTATRDLMELGTVESAAEHGKTPPFAKAKPGQIVFLLRPLSFLERLLHPFVKE